MLQHKNIVIIGGTTGLGLSAAKAFIAQGAKVVVVGRHEETVNEAKITFWNYLFSNYFPITCSIVTIKD